MQEKSHFILRFFMLGILSQIFSQNIFAMAIELDGDFGYDKQIYGSNRENSIVSRTYSAGLSTYIFSTTAIDFNFSRNTDITSNNDQYTITGFTVDHVADQSRVKTDVYGIGLKQMLAPRGSFLVPIISMGYAREIITSESDTTFLNTANGTKFIITEDATKQRMNSVFGAFILQLKMTEAISFKASIKTLFEAFKFNEARDNLKYSVGFAWIF